MSDVGYSERLVRASSEAFFSAVQRGQVNSLEYDNTLVTGPGVTDEYDPNVKTIPLTVASCWPGGVAGTTHQYVVHFEGARPSDQEALETRRFMQELLLGASIGEAAMERYRASGAEAYQKKISDQFGPALFPGLLDLCARQDAPYSMLMVGEVAASEVIEPGKRIGLLFFIGAAPIQDALAQLRRQAQHRVTEGN